LAAERARLRAEEHLASLVHRDVASFDADLRVGAVLVDGLGRVVVRRVEAPRERTSAFARVVDPFGASEGAPQRDWRRGLDPWRSTEQVRGPVQRPSTVDVPSGRGPSMSVEDVAVEAQQRARGWGWLGPLRWSRGERWGVP
jgi:hypothetical protein